MGTDVAGCPDKSRAVWNPVIDKLFADVMADHVTYARKSSSGFLSTGWYKILDEFNRRNGSSYDVMQLKNRFSLLKRMYHVVKELLTVDGFVWDGTSGCVVAEPAAWDNYLPGHPRAAQFRTTCFLAYEQMVIICDGSGATGSSAKSSISVVRRRKKEAKPSSPSMSQSPADEPGSSPDTSATPDGVNDDAMSEAKEDGRPPCLKRNQPSLAPPTSHHSKRSRAQTAGNNMSVSLWDAVAASKYDAEEMRSVAAEMAMTSGSFSITNCVKELIKLEGIDPALQVAASAYFRDPGMREMFMAWGKEQRLAWLDAIVRGRS